MDANARRLTDMWVFNPSSYECWRDAATGDSYELWREGEQVVRVAVNGEDVTPEETPHG